MSAPLTGHQTAADALIDEALAKFFTNPQDIQRKPTVGGVNNVTMHLVCSTGERFVMRIYNNGNNSDKVAFEHAILSALAAKSLSFMVPYAIPSLAGRSHELLSSGAECCVFRLIDGQLASTTSPEEVGRAAGELSAAMGEIQIEQASPTAPYYDLFQVHHAIHGDRQLFYSALETGSTPFPAVDACRESIDELLVQIRALEQRLITFHQWGLPSQIIHGDLHYDNVLVSGDAVTGLLDFEFCARDWRAMELAGNVCLENFQYFSTIFSLKILCIQLH
jgi:homoserine kinase type II